MIYFFKTNDFLLFKNDFSQNINDIYQIPDPPWSTLAPKLAVAEKK